MEIRLNSHPQRLKAHQSFLLVIKSMKTILHCSTSLGHLSWRVTVQTNRNQALQDILLQLYFNYITFVRGGYYNSMVK